MHPGHSLDLLTESVRDITIFKLASEQAFTDTARTYRQAAGYLELCLTDPFIPGAFRRIIAEKRKFLRHILDVADVAVIAEVLYVRRPG